MATTKLNAVQTGNLNDIISVIHTSEYGVVHDGASSGAKTTNDTVSPNVSNC